MRTLKTLALATAVSTGLLGSVGSMAANDGTLDTTSQGDFDITFSKDDQARIWGLVDLNLTDSNGSDGTALEHNFCVFSNKSGTGSNQYDMQIDSANGFKLINAVTGGSDPGTSLAYTVAFTDPISGTFNVDESGLTDTGQLSAGSLSDQPDPGIPDCSGQAKNKTTVAIQFTGANNAISNVASGSYYDLVTLTVSPK